LIIGLVIENLSLFYGMLIISLLSDLFFVATKGDAFPAKKIRKGMPSAFSIATLDFALGVVNSSGGKAL
jgi:hypothetical protein